MEIIAPEVSQAYTSKYAEMLLTLWENIVALEIKVKKNYLDGVLDRETLLQYISLLLTLYKELLPKVKGRSIEEKLKKYKAYYLDPDKLLEEPEKINNLTLHLREALEDLGITSIESV